MVPFGITCILPMGIFFWPIAHRAVSCLGRVNRHCRHDPETPGVNNTRLQFEPGAGLGKTRPSGYPSD
jgi:hypothetical protein